MMQPGLDGAPASESTGWVGSGIVSGSEKGVVKRRETNESIDVLRGR